MPLTAVNFLISYTLQAMGKGAQSALLTFSRQGLLNIPLLLLMNWIFGLYGMIWTQLVVEVIMLPVSLGMSHPRPSGPGPRPPREITFGFSLMNQRRLLPGGPGVEYPYKIRR